jgi:hypothetical protein
MRLSLKEDYQPKRQILTKRLLVIWLPQALAIGFSVTRAAGWYVISAALIQEGDTVIVVLTKIASMPIQLRLE